MKPPKKDKRTYAEKLQDCRWQEKRLKMLQAQNWTCQECTEYRPKKGLHIHHVFYMTGVEPWDHPEDIMLVLCGKCHKERQAVEQTFFRGVASVLTRKMTKEIYNFPATWFFKLPNNDVPYISPDK